MNLYLLRRIDNRGYDTNDSMIVCAKCDIAAKNIHPNPRIIGMNDRWHECDDNGELTPFPEKLFQYSTWSNSPINVSAELIGTAAPNIKEGIVLASFNAG